MKRHSTWKICTNGSLKVKRCTIVITKQLNEECHKDVKESSTHINYHVTVEVDSNPKSSEDELEKAPKVFEDEGKTIVDELK